MHILVFGASGKVGTLLVEQALQHGHQVTAFIHSSSTFEKRFARKGVRIIRGDIHDRPAVEQALQSAAFDAVVSVLGSWHTPQKDIVSAAMRTLVPAMQANNTAPSRLVSLTGAGAYAPTDRPSALYRLGHTIFGLAAGKIIRDAEEHIRILAASTLDWTVLRSPVMTSGHLAHYTLSLKAPLLWQTIPRKAVVKAIIDQLEGPGYSQQAPYIRP